MLSSHTLANGSGTMSPLKHMPAQASCMARIPSFLMESTSSDPLPVHGRKRMTARPMSSASPAPCWTDLSPGLQARTGSRGFCPDFHMPVLWRFI